ncbi:hypothetical protein EcWSU1_00603 [Enterobacter ludwigii]|uniref:Uncharacterized protein n=1 Tax=Enterobacter ludwigii TaxID=299767 RepID=G8LL78_9ENTR|nr:hypothetical protein EcWSU1_00603 [Enterobacter ludwigii]
MNKGIKNGELNSPSEIRYRLSDNLIRGISA